MDFNHRSNGNVRKMGQPGQSDVYVVPALTQLSVAFMQNPASLIVNRVVPSVPVKQQSGKYLQYPRGYFFRDDMALRADGSESVGGGFAVDNTPTFFADVWAWHTDIGPQVRANALQVDVDTAATKLCSNKALIRREKLFYSNYFKTGVWNTQVAGLTTGGGGSNANNTLGWLDATALPIKHLKAQIKAMENLTGYRPNKVIFSRDLWDIFCEHPNVISRIWNGQIPGAPAELSAAMVASWLFPDAGIGGPPGDVLVARGVETTSKEGQADTLGFMAASGQVLLLYCAPEPTLLEPSALYAFDWVADGLVGAYGNAVSRWYNQDRKSTRYEIEMATDMHLISADLGVLMSNFAV